MNLELLFPKQKLSFLNSTRRQNIWYGSVRSGKTHVSLIKWIYFLLTAPPGDTLMVGKTIRALERNVIMPMSELVGYNMRYFKGNGWIIFCGRKIYVEGANDERSEGKIRGMTLIGAYCDEITLWPESFYTMLLSRLSTVGAQLFGSTNPDSPYHWLKVNYLDNKELNIAQFDFKIDDNIYLPKEYVEDIKKEYVGLMYKRFILGLWALAEGAIYDFFNEDEHCISKCPTARQYYISIDYGTNNPTVFGLFGRNDFAKPKIWLEKEWYYDCKKTLRQLTDKEISLELKRFIGDKYISKIFVDPSAASLKAQLNLDGILGVSDARNDVLDGIRTQARMLKSGEYAVGINNQNTIDEYGAYVWDKKAQLKGEDKPIKQNDHSKDMERYCLFTLFGAVKFVDYSFLERMGVLE